MRKDESATMSIGRFEVRKESYNFAYVQLSATRFRQDQVESSPTTVKIEIVNRFLLSNYIINSLSLVSHLLYCDFHFRVISPDCTTKRGDITYIHVIFPGRNGRVL